MDSELSAAPSVLVPASGTADWLALQIGQNLLVCYGVSLALLLLLVTALRCCLARHCAADSSPGVRELAGKRNWRMPGVALAMVVGFASCFLGIALQISSDGALARFDSALAQTLAHSLVPTVAVFFSRLTHVGDTLTITLMAITVAVFLLWRRQPGLALLWLLAISGNSLLNVSLKAVFERVRPDFDPLLASAAGWSFPSGHSSGTLVMCGMLAFLAQRLLPPQWRLPSVLVAAALIWSVGVSRVVLRVHYFSDVLAGFCSGLAWLTLCLLVWHCRRLFLRR